MADGFIEAIEHAAVDAAGATLGFIGGNIRGAVAGYNFAEELWQARQSRRARKKQLRQQLEAYDDQRARKVPQGQGGAGGDNNLPNLSSINLSRMPAVRRMKKRTMKSNKKFVARRKRYIAKKKAMKRTKTIMKGKRPRVSRAFKKKVDRVLDEENPAGTYLVQNDYGISLTPGKQNTLTIPFKQTAEILTAAQTVFPNVIINNDIPVLNLELATMQLTAKNNTQIDLIVDMYKCVPAKWVVAATGEEFTTVWDQRIGEMIVPAALTPDHTLYGLTPYDATGLRRTWKYSKVWSKVFKPGAVWQELVVDKSLHTVNFQALQLTSDAGVTSYGNRRALFEEYVFVVRGPPGMSLAGGVTHFGTLGAGNNSVGSAGFNVFSVKRYKVRRPAVGAGTSKTQTFAYSSYSDAPVLGNQAVVEENNPIAVVIGAQ